MRKSDYDLIITNFFATICAISFFFFFLFQEIIVHLRPDDAVDCMQVLETVLPASVHAEPFGGFYAYHKEVGWVKRQTS